MNRQQSKDLFRKILTVWLACIAFAIILSLYAKFSGLSFRSLPSLIGRYVLATITLFVLFLFKRKMKKSSLVINILFVILTCVMLFFLSVETACADKESVVTRDGITKLKVERSFFNSLEITYYERFDAFSYKTYPCIREVYDDGDIGQLVYIDHYNETGELTLREFVR